jgi:hypothetical protein
MKGLIGGLLGIILMLIGGWSTISGVEESSAEPYAGPVIAGTVREIAGTWYRFPVGMLLQFNDDGSAIFGLDWDGTAVGYEARIWFEDQELSILFTNYDDQDEACASAAGLYTVQINEDGTISFELVHDDCHFRMEILSGSAESSTGLIYHPIQN